MLLRLFGIRDDPPPNRWTCPVCSVEHWDRPEPDPVDAYLRGASVEWLEAEIERREAVV